jgi:hypothetical protein
MSKTGRVSIRRLLAFALLVLASTSFSWAQTRPPIVEQIAKAYGLDSWDKVEAIRYTWHAEFPGVKVARTWTWEPKTGKVSYDGPEDKTGKPIKVSYLRSEIGSQSDVIKQVIDPGFQNDNYWTLFPFHAFWDTSATVTDEGMQKLPLGKGTARKVVVKYPSDGGYTPGDTWTLFVGADNRIKEFHYHRGGAVKPTIVIATWADYKKAGPLLLSLDHRGTADGKPLRIFTTEAAVKVAGSDAWMEAK